MKLRPVPRLACVSILLAAAAQAQTADVPLAPYLLAPENVVVDFPTGDCVMTSDRQQRGDRIVETVVLEPSDAAGTVRPTVRVIRFGSRVSRDDQLRALQESASRQKATMGALGGALVRETDIALGENPGKELLMTMDAQGRQLYRVRSYYLGSTQLMVSARGTPQQMTTGPYERLFGSIRLAAPGESPRAAVRCKP